MPDTEPPPRRRFLSVDFVTRLTVSECQDRLHSAPHVPGQSLTLQDDGSFTVRRSIPAERPVEIRLWGTLEPVKRGTWVWGTVIGPADAERSRAAVALVFVAAIFLALSVEALLRGAPGQALAWVLLLAGLGALAAIAWRGRNRHALQVVNWVYETLYVPPAHT